MSLQNSRIVFIDPYLVTEGMFKIMLKANFYFCVYQTVGAASESLKLFPSLENSSAEETIHHQGKTFSSVHWMRDLLVGPNLLGVAQVCPCRNAHVLRKDLIPLLWDLQTD